MSVSNEDSPEVRMLKKTALEQFVNNNECWEGGHIVLMHCDRCEARRFHNIKKTDTLHSADDPSKMLVEYDARCLGINEQERKPGSRECGHFQRSAYMPENEFNALLDNFKVDS
jgi:hypothetical protein